jgi:hypothetical protein
VRCGAEDKKGTQVALVLAVGGAMLGVRIRRWKDASKTWAQPTAIGHDKVLGTVPVGDRRRSVALRALTKEILATVEWNGRSAHG